MLTMTDYSTIKTIISSENGIVTGIIAALEVIYVSYVTLNAFRSLCLCLIPPNNTNNMNLQTAKLLHWSDAALCHPRSNFTWIQLQQRQVLASLRTVMSQNHLLVFYSAISMD